MSADIAIIGWDGRFPGARDVDGLWRLLLDGREGISRLTREQMAGAGVASDILDLPGYVNAAGVIADVELFDAELFGLSPREAALLDPQHRLLLECAWGGLEDAGHTPSGFDGCIGVFAGVGLPSYLLENVYAAAAKPPDDLLAFLGNDKDFAASRISYLLNLRGPSISVQSACSTSLVAVHMACQSLLLGECDMALAGAASVRVPQERGYLHTPDGIESRDGHCRPFDAASNGTVFGNGGAVVVLRPLEEAIADGDRVHAVIKGSAVNNDGSDKVGFAAPSFSGQARVVAEAMEIAGVASDSIAFVETHGTGTQLGDPVELRALTEAFRDGTRERRPCALGAIKSNIGHLDTAAGIAGLIKASLSLRERVLPATLHFERANDKLRLESSPFFVNDRALPLASDNGPLRAGVSSFGLGGTNAHVVLEGPRSVEVEPTAGPHLLAFSARTPAARGDVVARVAAALRAATAIDLASVAFTLGAGREKLEHRAICVVADDESASTRLESTDLVVDRVAGQAPELCLLLPGQGAQTVGAGRGLYRDEPVFRREIDAAADVLAEHLEVPLHDLLFPADVTRAASERLRETQFTQPALFAFECALVRLLESWGVRPDLLLGHSLGEYVAAHIAGVFTFEQGLRLVCTRGRLIQQVESGAMLAAALPLDQVAGVLPDRVSVAAINGEADIVFSGRHELIADLQGRLDAGGIPAVRLQGSHAFHSEMMEPIADRFLAAMSEVALRPPRVPVISNVTGAPLTDEQACDPSYWLRHLRGTVRFADAAGWVLGRSDVDFVEVGPGHTLSRLLRRHPRFDGQHRAYTAVGTAKDDSDARAAREAAGRLWLRGRPLDWRALDGRARPARVSLPTYPFQRSRHWVEPAAAPFVPLRPSPGDHPLGVYAPSWRRRHVVRDPAAPATGLWTVIADTAQNAALYEAALIRRGASCVQPSVIGARDVSGVLYVDTQHDHEPQMRGRLSDVLANLASAGVANPLLVVALTQGLCQVTGGESLCAARAPVVGLLRSAVEEMPAIRVVHRDVEPDALLDPGPILDDVLARGTPPILAERNGFHWEPAFEAQTVLSASRATAGAYLVTGGTGRIGLEVARAIVEAAGPEGVDLHLLARSTPDAAARARIESLGTRVAVHAIDVTDETAVSDLVRSLVATHGSIAGVVHAAGAVSRDAFCPLAELTAGALPDQFAAKLRGIEVLDRALRDVPVGCRVAVSSLAALVGGIGYAGYAGANAFVDTFCLASGGTWTSLAFDAWDFGRPEVPLGRAGGLQPAQAASTLVALLGAAPSPRSGLLWVCAGSIEQRWQDWLSLATTSTMSAKPVDLDHAADPVGQIWMDVLGVDRAEPGEDFFVLGGSSLQAVALLARLRNELEVELRLHDLMDASSFHELRTLVDAAHGAAIVEPIPRAPEGEACPLTYAQRRLWIEEHLGSDESAFHIGDAFRIEGPLDSGALALALDRLVARHDALRTRFGEVDGQPIQYVDAAAPGTLRVQALPVDPGNDVAVLARKVADDELRTPFDLAVGPLFRGRLLVHSDVSATLVLCLHHIVGDDWSIGQLMRELGLAYDALVRGTPVELPALRTTYADFAAWQHSADRERRHGDQLEFWVRRLSGSPEQPCIAPVKHSDDERSTRSWVAPVHVNPDLIARARALAHEESASLFAVLLGAFEAVLAVRSQTSDIVVGTPSTGRPHPWLENVVGIFINPLVLRTDLQGDPTFREVVRRVRATVLEAHDHEDLPYERLAQRLRADGHRSPRPLLHTWFTVLTHGDELRSLSDLSVSPLRLAHRPARFDIALVLEPDGDGLVGHLETSADLYPSDVGEELAAAYHTLLAHVLANADVTLAQLAPAPAATAHEPAVPPASPRPRRVPRRPVRTTPEGLVRVGPLLEGDPLPTVVSPVVSGVDLLAWAKDAARHIDDLLLEHRALLFRGFMREGELSDTLFADFADATSSGGMLPYRDRSTPRERVAGSVYTSTVYPADRTIEQHNEGSYWRQWPMKVYFGALRVPRLGGATPIADVRRVLRRLSPDTRLAFEEHGFMLVRNFNDGFGLPWQESFQTDDPAEVGRYCEANDIRFEWRGGDRLRTEQVRPAIHVHPRTGEQLWFNHAAFFHATAHSPEIHAALTAELGEDGLPWLTYFGNGEAIPPEMITEIRAAYRAETRSFPWQSGDILLLDNMTISHGREAFEGDRLTLVAMTEPQEGPPA